MTVRVFTLQRISVGYRCYYGVVVTRGPNNIEFDVRGHVFLKISFFKRVMRFGKKGKLSVTPQIRDVTGQRQTYTYASEALTY